MAWFTSSVEAHKKTIKKRLTQHTNNSVVNDSSTAIIRIISKLLAQTKNLIGDNPFRRTLREIRTYNR